MFDFAQNKQRTLITEIVGEKTEENLDQSGHAGENSGHSRREKDQVKYSYARKSKPGKDSGSKNRKQAWGKQYIDRVLKIKEQNIRVRKILRNIKEHIDPIWKQSDPPAKGRVLLRLAIDCQGRVAVLNAASLQKSELGMYIYKMVRRAAPFKAAMEHRKEPIQIECVFSVQD